MLHWVLRDGRLVNLPWALLVRGDTLLLRPGQAAPALCSSSSGLRLARGEVLRSEEDGATSWPEFQPGTPPLGLQLLETPCLPEVEVVLASATLRPLSQLTKQRRFLVDSLLGHAAFPLTLLTVLVLNCLRKQLPDSVSLSLLPLQVPDSQAFPQLFLQEPAAACLPLLPLTLPLWWLLTNTAALAHVLTLFRQQAPLKTEKAADPFDDTVESPGMEESSAPLVSWSGAASTLASCLAGRGEWLCRTENLLHCLGSVTSYCCADRKGVLAWPNTCPERIFFLRQQEVEQQQEDARSTSVTVPEVLTVTHNVHNPFHVNFDDTSWEQHLASLKPLGLTGQLSSCSLAASNKTPLSSLEQEVGPGCLCEFERLVGLQKGQDVGWGLEQVCPSSRPGSSSPHMVSLVAKEQGGVGLQLLSQGSADFVLDSCQDAWTGQDLAKLSPGLKKKCLEFHHRASLTSYCTAFSYRPLAVAPCWPPGHHLLLPPHTSPLLAPWRSQESVDRVSCSGWSEETLEPSEDLRACLQTQGSQTFLGMVQMQYQARVDMVQFIDLLEKACIRFVHFSKENELRSRVFSEKMGLESGWNCHISLAPGTNLATATAAMYGGKERHRLAKGGVGGKLGWVRSSLPARMDSDHGPALRDFPAWAEKPLLGGEEGEESRSGSTSSLEYDMSNRAQLPAGIDAIRPHLEKMDNVPLLVSLFTDCTPASTRQMVEIMQENGEVVAMLGSSANHQNMRTFLAADASLAVEPLYPQVCRKVPVCKPSQASDLLAPRLSPTALAQRVVAVAASISFSREEDISLYQAIIASRRHVLAIKHSLQFWTSSCLFLSLLVLTSLLMTAPLPLSPPQLLLLSSVHIPLLATATFLSSQESNIRNISTGKNNPIAFIKASVWQACWSHGLRFLPSLLAILTSHVLSVLRLCSFLDLEQEGETQQCRLLLPSHLGFIQTANMTFASAAVTLSALCSVSSTDHSWRYRLRHSWHLLLVLLLLATCHTLVLLHAGLSTGLTLPPEAWAILGGSVPTTFAVNELIKRHQIKVNVRFQKRARLEFGTKLGINSPF